MGFAGTMQPLLHVSLVASYSSKFHPGTFYLTWPERTCKGFKLVRSPPGHSIDSSILRGAENWGKVLRSTWKCVEARFSNDCRRMLRIQRLPGISPHPSSFQPALLSHVYSIREMLSSRPRSRLLEVLGRSDPSPGGLRSSGHAGHARDRRSTAGPRTSTRCRCGKSQDPA